MMPGTIGVCANDTGRFTVFSLSLAGIASPPGSQIAWAVGSDIVNSRNLLVAERFHGDWIWFMDDDHAFKPGILTALLAHDVDVVAPVCLMRQEPFLPVALRGRDRSIDLANQEHEGLLEVWATGTAGMLIRRSVFERLPDPPFVRGETSEDYLFCERLRQASIPIYVDLGLRLGHATTTVIWPGETEDGDWCVDFQISDSFFVEGALPR